MVNDNRYVVQFENERIAYTFSKRETSIDSRIVFYEFKQLYSFIYRNGEATSSNAKFSLDRGRVAERKRSFRTIFKVLSRLFFLLILVSIKSRRERSEVVLGFDIAFSFTLLFPTTLGRWLRTAVTLILQVADAGVTSTLLLRERERTFSAMAKALEGNTVFSYSTYRNSTESLREPCYRVQGKRVGWGRGKKKNEDKGTESGPKCARYTLETRKVPRLFSLE